MKTGISTASLFGRFFTEDALKFLSDNKVKTAEVFLESYGEYTEEFGKILKEKKGDTEVHSVHTLTTQFEPQLYSLNKRAKDDSFALLKSTMACAKEVGAKYYTFHGGARFKRIETALNYDKVGKETQDIIDVCAEYGVSLAYENVHWGYYNHVGFFTEMKKRTHGLKGTFDIKQARLSGDPLEGYINEMGSAIVTAHLSDVRADGSMCLPFSKDGITDFTEVLSRLNDVGFDGAILLEVYKNDFKEFPELFDSLDKLNYTAKKVFSAK